MTTATAKRFLMKHCNRTQMRKVATQIGATKSRLKEDLATNIARSPQRGKIKVQTTLSV